MIIFVCGDSCGRLKFGQEREEERITEASQRNAPNFFKAATPFVESVFEETWDNSIMIKRIVARNYLLFKAFAKEVSEKKFLTKVQ